MVKDDRRWAQGFSWRDINGLMERSVAGNSEILGKRNILVLVLALVGDIKEHVNNCSYDFRLKGLDALEILAFCVTPKFYAVRPYWFDVHVLYEYFVFQKSEKPPLWVVKRLK